MRLSVDNNNNINNYNNISNYNNSLKKYSNHESLYGFAYNNNNNTNYNNSNESLSGVNDWHWLASHCSILSKHSVSR